jgi:mono/diheme cytochrome c family protein
VSNQQRLSSRATERQRGRPGTHRTTQQAERWVPALAEPVIGPRFARTRWRGRADSGVVFGHRVLRTIGALLLCFAPTFVSAQSAPPTPQQIDDGRAIYDDFCVTCHGRDMVTSGAVAFDLRKFPKDDFTRFRNSVLNGKPPAMPAWRDKVSDEEVLLLWAYVRGGP